MANVSIATITPAKVKLNTTASPVTALSVMGIRVTAMLHYCMYTDHNYANIYPELLLLLTLQYYLRQ